MKQTEVGPLINNSDLKLPNGRYSIKHKKFSKILVSSDRAREPKFHKYDIFDKNDNFPAPTLYMQLPDPRAIHRWKELFNPKKMTYHFSVNFNIW